MVAPSSDFTYPPTDGSVPPALAIDFHLKHNPSQLFAVLHDVNDSSQTEVTYEQLTHAVHRAAHILNPKGTIPQGTSIGFLVSTHTIEYIIIILGAMRAGLVPFPISPRTHVPGIAHLITSTQTAYIVAGGSKSIDDLRSQVERALSESNFDVKFIQLPPLGEVLSSLGQTTTQAEQEPFPSLQRLNKDSFVSILHSSGSTGMPRPVKYHLEGVFKNAVNQPIGWVYAGTGVKVGTMALPTFHIMASPRTTRYTQVLFAPNHTPIVPTPNLVIQAVVNAKCGYLMCVPAFLEAWAQDKDAIAHLQGMKGIMFGGGSLADGIGNKLVGQGVPIISCYGATELGAVTQVQDHGDLSDWGYVKFSPKVDAQFVPQNDEGNTYELVLVEDKNHKPFVLDSELDGKPAYRTKDLVVRHPVKPDLWKFVGRLDDQIVMLNGEKTNPGPMEAVILGSPLVRCAVMFGRERNQTGILIEPEPTVIDKSYTKESRLELVELIWPYVERANQMSPTHSRLARPTIILADPARPLPRTLKGAVSRSAALKLYEHEVQAMYIALEADYDDIDCVKPPESWLDSAAVEAWVGASVASILGHNVDATGDLFQQGLDSLTATMLLRTLKSTLHASLDVHVRDAAKKINQQTIFGKPTLKQLAALLVQLCTSVDATSDPVAESLEAIQVMIQKYDSNWTCTNVRSCQQPVKKESVVVTGTTGGLGSHLLAQLLASDKVRKVWAMNRWSSKGNREREISAFEDRLLDVGLLESEKLMLLDTDLEDAKLGLRDEVYNEIRNSVTVIIHNAWQINFNLSLQSFEPSIRGARNLLDLAFNSTTPTGLPRFAFTSSISVAGFGGPGRRLTEVSVNPEDAADGIGYGQSKLVTEKILESARSAGLETCSVRLGQLTGDVKSGAWTVTDWVPSLIGSSVSIGCLPAAVGTVSWLPLDIAARSIIDACTARDTTLPPFIHTAHPRPVPWDDVMSLFVGALASRARSESDVSLPIVPFNEWNQRVATSAASFNGSERERYKRFPSTKVQSTIDGMVRADEELRSRARGEAGDAESGGTVRLDTSKAQGLSETLKNTCELGKEHTEKWVGYWEARGLFV